MKEFSLVHIIATAIVALIAGILLGYTGATLIGVQTGTDGSLIGAPPDRFAGSVNSFNECAAAGNPVMESYPRQCRTQDGRLFVEDVKTSPEPPATPMPVEPDGGIGNGASGCVPAGCSGTICAELGEADSIVTTCEYRAEYACYELTKCERQADGKCGWTETPEFSSCLSSPPPLQ